MFWVHASACLSAAFRWRSKLKFSLRIWTRMPKKLDYKLLILIQFGMCVKLWVHPFSVLPSSEAQRRQSAFRVWTQNFYVILNLNWYYNDFRFGTERVILKFAINLLLTLAFVNVNLVFTFHKITAAFRSFDVSFRCARFSRRRFGFGGGFCFGLRWFRLDRHRLCFRRRFCRCRRLGICRPWQTADKQ